MKHPISTFVIFAVLMTLVWLVGTGLARAQPFYGDPYDGARAAQWSYGARNVYSWGGPPPLAYAPVAPPVLEALPPPPPPPPLGWVSGRLTACADPPACRAVVISVYADGANVRAVPGGPVVGSLANGVPVVPLRREGEWILVAPGCALGPTYTWSVTAGVPLSVCM